MARENRVASDWNRDKTAEDAFAQAMFARLAGKAEPLLQKKLDALGVNDFRALSREEAKRLWRESLLEATALYAPEADHEGMRRAAAAFTSDRFIAALSKERPRALEFGAFDAAVGIDAAIILAAFGLPVMPLDRKTHRPIGNVAHSIEEAELIFGRAKTAVVGYEPARAPFFLVVTDCVNTLSRRLTTDPRFAAAKALMTRDGGTIAPPMAQSFKHGAIMIARLPGDELETLVVEDPSPQAGSIMLLGGWMEGEEVHGTPVASVMVPRRLLTELLEDPSAIFWLTRPLSPKLSRPH